MRRECERGTILHLSATLRQFAVSAVDGAEYPWRAENAQGRIRNRVSLASMCIANETMRALAILVSRCPKSLSPVLVTVWNCVPKCAAR
jgi:hypothetical protein